MTQKENWFCFKKEPFFNKNDTLIIYYRYEEMAIVRWEDGWDGPHWYSADKEHYYREEEIVYWMKAPKPPKKDVGPLLLEKEGK